MTAHAPSLLSSWEILFRLGMALVAGGMLGLNRELKHKPAGLRTHAMVALGAAMVVLLILEFPASGMTFDANAMSRVIQGILTGIGFLGGGVILRAEREQTIHGLTTAASIWVVACLGIACGAGRWRVAVFTAILALVVLVLGGPLESAFHRLFHAADHSPGGTKVPSSGTPSQGVNEPS